MKVYGIYFGCVHEGGGCEDKLYVSLEKAREAALALVAKQQEYLVKMREYEKKGGFVSGVYDEDWTETEENEWLGVHDRICIQEFELIQ